MQYRKPHYYQDFSCTADHCPDTCCAGWQIVIDEKSLENYSQTEGDFGIRLLNSIDWREGIFEQHKKRCSFLNEENLCDIYKELGENALCDTCRLYPRHIEEFENLRELSLSLSCPVAAEMILGCKDKVRFIEEEDETEENEEEYEDFDFLLFDQLMEVREVLIKVIQNREVSIEQRMILVLKISLIFQQALDAGTLFELDLKQELKKITEEEQRPLGKSRLRSMQAMLKDLRLLEVLRDEWPQNLEDLEKTLYINGEDFYRNLRHEFIKWTKKGLENELQWDICKEQILMFFIYTYFCGAVYDDMIYTKAVLAVFSVLWIEELALARWERKSGNLEFQELVRIAYQYAREIEHSDENLNLLEEIFDENSLYSPQSFEEIMTE